MIEDTNITVIPKGEERYVYIWDEPHRPDLLKTFGRQAANPELSFTWLDACRASMAIRKYEPECEGV